MILNMTPPSPLEYFAQLVKSDDELPLLEAAAALAHDAHPGLDTQQVLNEVDALAARLRKRVPLGAGSLLRLGALNQLFFDELKFGLNHNDYYHPDNSFVHCVLAQRQGIPISLAVLWLELAQGMGLKALGVGFPGHFLVSVQVPQGLVVIDPATGESLGRDQLSEYLESLAPVDEAHLVLDAFLQPATPREVLARMLRNLREIYLAQGDQLRLLGVLDRLVVLLPDVAEFRHERGRLHDEMGHVTAALADLAWCLQNGEGDEQTAQRVAQLRWMLG